MSSSSINASSVFVFVSFKKFKYEQRVFYVLLFKDIFSLYIRCNAVKYNLINEQAFQEILRQIPHFNRNENPKNLSGLNKES